jgi:hypothetical protein
VPFSYGFCFDVSFDLVFTLTLFYGCVFKCFFAISFIARFGQFLFLKHFCGYSCFDLLELAEASRVGLS